MRDSFRSSVLCLLAIACLLMSAAAFAADSSATTTADPTNAATSAAPTGGASVGAVISPTLVDLLVKKGNPDHSGSQQPAQYLRFRRDAAATPFAEGQRCCQ